MSPSIVPVQSSALVETSELVLARYAQILDIDECAFWGVNPGTGYTAGQSCPNIWTLSERKTVADVLAKAQRQIQTELGYLLGYQWTVESRKRLGNSNVVEADWQRIIAAGVKAETIISDSAAVNHATDPAVVGPIVTTVTDEDEIQIFYEDTEIRIIPSSITISGGQVTIEIPRCRLVKPDLQDNPASGLSYSDLNNFVANVDVVRIYNDESTNATLYYPGTCSAFCSCPTCTNNSQAACMRLDYDHDGFFTVFPASYSNGSWTRTRTTCCRDYQSVVLRYLSGVELDHLAEQAIIRLAHSQLPTEPCGACESVKKYWSRDRNVPQQITSEQANCPFGRSDGAWHAWIYTQEMKDWELMVL